MATKPPASEGARIAPRKRAEDKRKAPKLFRFLFKVLEALALILDVVTDIRDLV